MSVFRNCNSFNVFFISRLVYFLFLSRYYFWTLSSLKSMNLLLPWFYFILSSSLWSCIRHLLQGIIVFYNNRFRFWHKPLLIHSETNSLFPVQQTIYLYLTFDYKNSFKFQSPMHADSLFVATKSYDFHMRHLCDSILILLS